MVSIIVPVYNCESYLRRCVNSVIEQTVNEWEIVAVNDGSTDGSLNILNEFESNDSRIKVISQSNSGVVNARKIALKYATGEYLLFLDADDYLPENALSLMATQLDITNADLCVGSFTLEWESNGHQVLVNHRKRFASAKGCFKYCMAHGEMFLAIKMYRTELYKHVVNIPSDVIIQEDVIGLTQYLQHASSATYVNDNVYFYVKRAQSVTGKFTPRHISSLLIVAGFLCDNQFAMSMSSVVNRHCAHIMLSCMQSKSTDLQDAEINMIWNRIPLFYRIEAKCSHIKARFKHLIKKLIWH